MADDKELTRELEALRQEVERLNSHPAMVLQGSPWRLMGMRFAGGLAFGLGTVLGGTILLSFLIMALGSIDFIPVIGEWAAQIAIEMNNAR